MNLETIFTINRLIVWLIKWQNIVKNGHHSFLQLKPTCLNDLFYLPTVKILKGIHFTKINFERTLHRRNSCHLFLIFSFCFSWYGSETAPLLFASNPPDQSHQHHSFYSTPQTWPWPLTAIRATVYSMTFISRTNHTQLLAGSDPPVSAVILHWKPQEIITKQWICTL